MAISPPSDIVMDVVNAADPTKLQEAQEKLQSASATLAAARLTQDGKGFSTDVASMDNSIGLRQDVKVSGKDSHTPDAYRKFEAMVLQNFIQYMLPSDSSDVYGKGIAGNVWKGMMAEQMANAIAKNGGIGIADHLMRGTTYDRGRTHQDRADQLGHINNVAASISDTQERKAMAKLLPGEGETTDSSTRI